MRDILLIDKEKTAKLELLQYLRKEIAEIAKKEFLKEFVQVRYVFTEKYKPIVVTFKVDNNNSYDF